MVSSALWTAHSHYYYHSSATAKRTRHGSSRVTVCCFDKHHISTFTPLPLVVVSSVKIFIRDTFITVSALFKQISIDMFTVLCSSISIIKRIRQLSTWSSM